ncbi:MAG: response regulator [Anaerolineales bacterium]|nr:response regulator [Anaerolineales bacterium]
MARVYVIDDDEQLLRMVGLMLQRGGHTTTLISNPIDGLEQIKADKPDLLLLDVMMPNMSGHDLARQIRNDKNLSDLPILILTARSQEIDRMTALESGADGYLSKPVTSQELIEKVDSLLTKTTQKQEPQQGIVIAIFGLRGGTGRTSLAVNLAAALRRQSQQEVCLAELTGSSSQVSLHLRMQSRNSWADLLAEEALSWELVKNQLLIHPSGLRVLPAPITPQSSATPTAEKTTAILDTLRQNVSFIVVDLPPMLTPAFETTLRASDIAMHVVAPEMIAVQTAVQTNRALAQSNINLRYKVHILNQTEPEAQLPQATIERALNTRIAFQVGYDANQPRSLAQGVPLTLTAAKSPLPTVVNRMAEVIVQRILKRES